MKDLSFSKLLVTLIGAGLSASLFTGCASRVQSSNFNSQIKLATDMAEPIVFQINGGPVDEDSSESGLLTLESAIQRALRSDSQVQAALARTRIAWADATQARLLPNPILSVAIRFPEGSGRPAIEAGLAADLISILQRPRQISAADHRLRAAGSEMLTVVLNILVNVQEQYATVQALDAQTGILNERRKLIHRLLELAQSRLRAGEAGRLDVLTLDTERAELEAEILQRAAERTDARLVLTRLIGQPSGQADWEVSPWEPLALSQPDEATWIASALKNRPEIQAQRWKLAALGDEVALARFAPFQGGAAGLDVEREEDWSAGPAVASPLPLFDWGQAARRKAQARRIEARHQFTQVRRQVVEDVRRAMAALSASRAALDQMQSELIPLQQRRLEQAQSAYKAGAADVTAILLAEQDLQAARAKLIELQQKTAAALYRLQRAVGGPGVAETLKAATQPSTPTSTT